jgi:hypothetical protein
MSDLGWRADGIDRAKAAGGVELEVYTRPGFTGGKAVRRSEVGAGGSGFEIGEYEDSADPTPEEFGR